MAIHTVFCLTLLLFSSCRGASRASSLLQHIRNSGILDNGKVRTWQRTAGREPGEDEEEHGIVFADGDSDERGALFCSSPNRIARGAHHKSGTQFANKIMTCFVRHCNCSACTEPSANVAIWYWSGVVHSECDRVLHMIRDPREMVLSAYLYHSQKRAPEKWLRSPIDTWLRDTDPVTGTGSADLTDLCGRNLTLLSDPPQEGERYHDYLRRAPEQDGILFEMMAKSCQAVAGMLDAFARSYDDDRVLPICLEEAFYDFNGVKLKIAAHFGVQPLNDQLSSCLEKQNPSHQHSGKSNHVTYDSVGAERSKRLRNIIQMLDERYFAGLYTRSAVSDHCQRPGASSSSQLYRITHGAIVEEHIAAFMSIMD